MLAFSRIYIPEYMYMTENCGFMYFSRYQFFVDTSFYGFAKSYIKEPIEKM